MTAARGDDRRAGEQQAERDVTDEQDAATCPDCGAHDQHPNHASSGCPYGLVRHAGWCPRLATLTATPTREDNNA